MKRFTNQIVLQQITTTCLSFIHKCAATTCLFSVQIHYCLLKISYPSMDKLGTSTTCSCREVFFLDQSSMQTFTQHTKEINTKTTKAHYSTPPVTFISTQGLCWPKLPYPWTSQNLGLLDFRIIAFGFKLTFKDLMGLLQSWKDAPLATKRRFRSHDWPRADSIGSMLCLLFNFFSTRKQETQTTAQLNESYIWQHVQSEDAT
jgi:hypothetical protein